MIEQEATICTCDKPHFFQLSGGRLRCFNCSGFSQPVTPTSSTSPQIPSACPKCGSTAKPWQSKYSSRCGACGHVIDFAVKPVDRSPVKAARPEMVAAGPSHAVSFSSPTRSA